MQSTRSSSMIAFLISPSFPPAESEPLAMTVAHIPLSDR